MTPVQRLPTVTWEHWPLIILVEYEMAPQRVHTATGRGLSSVSSSDVWSDMDMRDRLQIHEFGLRVNPVSHENRNQ
jgi:hypothetical protein